MELSNNPIGKIGRNQFIGTTIIVFVFILLSQKISEFGEILTFDYNNPYQFFIKILILFSLGAFVGFSIENLVGILGDLLLSTSLFFRWKDDKEYKENISVIRKIMLSVFPFKEPIYWKEKTTIKEEYYHTYQASFFITQEITREEISWFSLMSPLKNLEKSKFSIVMCVIFSLVSIIGIIIIFSLSIISQSYLSVLFLSLFLSILFFESYQFQYLDYVRDITNLLIKQYAEIERKQKSEKEKLEMEKEKIELNKQRLNIEKELKERELALKEREIIAYEKEVGIKTEKSKKEEAKIEKLAPKPMIKIDIPEPDGLIWVDYYINITNIGRGVAKNIKVEYEAKFVNESTEKKSYIINALAPNDRVSRKIFSWRLVRVGKLIVKISYFDEENKEYEEKSERYFSYYKD